MPFPERSLLILHEGWGRTADIDSVARRFSSRGYDVITPDLFDGEPPAIVLRSVFRQLRTGRGRFFDRAWSALDQVGRGAAILGLSLGAAVAFRMATDVPIVAAYGHVPRRILASGPILGVYGRRDPLLIASGIRLGRHDAADVRWFKGAGHSFLMDPSVSTSPAPGLGPHPVADEAWAEIEGFFDLHLASAQR